MPFPHFLLGTFTAFIWGVNFIAIKISYEIFTPFWLISTRFFLSFFPFIFFIPRPKTPLSKLLSIALIMWFGQFVFVFGAVYQGVPTGLTAVLLQVNVILTALLAWILLKKTLSFKSLLALGLSFLGIILIAVHMMTPANWVGYLFVFLSAACVAVGNLSLKTPQGENIFSIIVWSSLLAFIPSCLFGFYLEGLDRFFVICHSFTLKICGSVLFTSYFSTVIANFIWVFLMRHYEVNKVAPFTLLVPIFALVGATFYLHESLNWVLVVGSILVVGGLGLNYVGPRTAYKPEQQISPPSNKAG